jgi:basic membrane lipoprotein Med (substrate-binding protein (PBP1-ABC) superfamily)
VILIASLVAALVLGSGLAAPLHAQAPLKVAAVFETPIEEPWVNQIHVALLRAKKDLGIQYEWSESVKSADFARVMREYAEKGYQLITGDAFGAERIARRVAVDYPKIAFVFGSGIGPAEPNFGVFDNWIHEPAFLSGMIAGKMTKSNTIGVVAAMPIPEVNRLANAFYAGAKEVNPKVKCKFSFIGSFFDPPKAKEAALAQIEAGVDVIYAERFGVIEAAKEKGILAISNMSDQSSLGPDTVITGLNDRIGWYHHNIKSEGPAEHARIQGVSDFPRKDPLLHRTFGALLGQAVRREEQPQHGENRHTKSHREVHRIGGFGPTWPDALELVLVAV